ncbi:hypothetical protein B0H17DRAFT_1191955 [Mycena rosella]|uniref:MYND-type domain-containing protein n=1 Tax=Mycena rosella TaxID=1033263 RepID=A0AAD7GXV3_MYCRO|nr:hypothetical protein B0H17DRAFT_1191955 [Mycena rosella]
MAPRSHTNPSLEGQRSVIPCHARHSEAQRHGGAVAVELTAHYGGNARDTYFKSFQNYGEEYPVYFNMSRRLPRNAALYKLFGEDPRRPGKRPTFRGDVVVVASKTVHVLEGLSSMYPVRMYIDFPTFMMESAEEIMVKWYRSTTWADTRFKDEQDTELPPGALPPTWDWRHPTHIPGLPYDAYDKENRQREKASERLIAADNKRQERYARFAARCCAGCSTAELPTRSICARCHRAHYCSVVCQKAHWKEHKQYCRSAEVDVL